MRNGCDRSDVLVIGGGPAGSTISALLSMKGWRVTLLEKARHPRFHIGESLLPGNMPIFERLGIMDELNRIGVIKRAVDFTLAPDDRYVTFDFALSDTAYKTAFQVRRAEFDHLLLRTAADKGADVVEGMRANEIRLDREAPVRVRGVDEDGAVHAWDADFVVDASGRDTFLANRLGLKMRDPRHNGAAVFAHFAGGRRRSGEEAGNISVYWFDHGWIWMIPLRGDTISVGIVSRPGFVKRRKTTVERLFADTISQCPPVAERLRGARLATPVTATGNYAYACRKMYGDRYLLVGDAYAFVDPVFSSGVYFAMFGAALGAETVDSCLRRPARRRVYLRRHQRTVRRGLTQLSWFIHRFTSPALQRMFMTPKDQLNMRRAIVSLLAGQVFDTRRFAVPLAAFKGMYYILTLANPRWSVTGGLPPKL